MNRRDLVKQGACVMAGIAISPNGIAHSAQSQTFESPLSLTGGRYITHVSVVSVDGIEVTRNKWIGGDVSSSNGPESVRARSAAFCAGDPNGRMTWSLSWGALNDQRPEYRDVRRLLADYHHKYGDEVTFFVGGYFSPMYDTRANVNRDIKDALKLISAMVGDNYRSESVIAGFMAAENQRYLAEEEGIHVCQGQIWSQHDIDHGDGDGGISYPYYPSREHYLKPAQDASDFIDCVCLDGWTCDFLAARHNGVGPGYNSRMGVGPIETVNNLGRVRGRKEMLDTTACHFDMGFKLNGFGWVTAIWELSLPTNLNSDLAYWIQECKRQWPETRCVTEGEFGLCWREKYADNSKLNYRFVARGTGAPGSDPNEEIRWFMNRDFRLALLRNWRDNGPSYVIDFTRYDLAAREPRDLRRDWSLMSVINQKGTRRQDKPLRISQLSSEDQHRILRRYPEVSGS